MQKKDDLRKKAEKLVGKMTTEEKIHMLTTHQHAVERLGIGEFYIGCEAARGYVGREPEKYSTVFPQPVGLAGTFDKELMWLLGGVAGREFRAYYNEEKKGGLCVWGPTVDMERDPRWGRTEEAYGEDVFLAGEMTRAYTLGLAGNDDTYLMTIPTLKRFCANNNEATRIDCNVFMPPRLKYEYYYAAFMNAIKFGGAKSVMACYNSINGVPGMLNRDLQTVLKEKWGMWFTVTDGGDFAQTVTAHRYCRDHSETLAEALKAGCDIMTDSDDLVVKSAEKALKDGLITEKDIDRSVQNTIYARMMLGQFDENCPYNDISKNIIDNEESREVNLRAAREQIVLLKNNGILPLKEKPKRIAVVGPLADENLRDWYTGYFRDKVSILKGIKKEFPGVQITHDTLWDRIIIKASNGKYLKIHDDGIVYADATKSKADVFELQDWGENWCNFFSVKHKKYLRLDDGKLKLHNHTVYDWFTRETFNLFYGYDNIAIEDYQFHQKMTADREGNITFVKRRALMPENNFDIVNVSFGETRAEELAEKCDLVIYCTGNHPVQTAKECYDRKTLELNVQSDMADVLYNSNKNTLMVLVSSYPYAIEHENAILPAIIYTSHAGAHLGTAVAETLTGKNNPAGRLAMTWYKSESELPDIEDYDIENAGTTYMYYKGEPLYPFGYGLSYSHFLYGGLRVTHNEFGTAAEVIITNESDIDGEEVVQFYYTVKDSAVSRPIRKLCGFERVHVESLISKKVIVEIPEHILQIFDTHSGEMLTESGTYIFGAGGSSGDIQVTAEVKINGDTITPRKDKFEAQMFDEHSDIRIDYAKDIEKYYIISSGWSAKAVYNDIDFSGKKELVITAGCITGKGKLTIKLGDNALEAEITPSCSYSDTGEYKFALQENIPADTPLTLNISENVFVYDIAVK